MSRAFTYIFRLLSAAAATCALCACWQSRPAAEIAAEKGILLVGNGADPATLDPSLATGFGEFKILSGLFEGLVCADTKTLEPKPATAKSWEISDGGKKYTFRLDENAKWSDGSKVTANDFVFAWRRALLPQIGSEYSSLFAPIKNAEKIRAGIEKDTAKLGARAEGDGTLVVELERPTPHFLSMLCHNAFFPLPQKTLEKFGACDRRNSVWTRPGNMVSNGPFTLAEWRINDRVSLRRNPHFRAAKMLKLNGVDFFPISNINTEDRAFRSGQLHITESVSPARIEHTKKNFPKCLRADPWLGVYYYMLNSSRPPLDNPLVRKALSMAIDRKAIIDGILKGGQTPAFSFVPPNCGTYSTPPEFMVREDTAAARKLLADAGYPGGRGLGKITITYNTSEQHKPIAEAIANMWKKNLGVDAELYNLSWPAYLAARRSGDFCVARSSWVADFADPESFLSNFVSDSGLNHSRYSNARFDKLCDDASNAADKSARNRKLAEAEGVLLADAALIPVYFYSRSYLISPQVRGWDSNPLDYHNFLGVSLDASAK